jgi:hypothetical protein
MVLDGRIFYFTMLPPLGTFKSTSREDEGLKGTKGLMDEEMKEIICH